MAIRNLSRLGTRPVRIAGKHFIRNRGHWYYAGGVALALLAVFTPPIVLKIMLAWGALICLYVGSGYLFSINGMLFKDVNGRLPPLVKILLAPFFFFSHTYNAFKRKTDPAPPMTEIRPGLFLGRRILPTDTDLIRENRINAILDSTVEFDALDFSSIEPDMAYLNVPIFDHGVPNIHNLHKAVQWLDQMRKQNRRVVVHCALGRGRSATILIAYLLYHDQSKDIRKATADVTQLRKTVSPNFHQLRLLETYIKSPLFQRKKHTVMIVNSRAGGNSAAEKTEQIKSMLSPFMELHIKETQSIEDIKSAAELARQESADTVIAMGGDGTVSAVAEKLLNSEVKLAIIPAGTANAFANCLYGASVQWESLQTSCERIIEGSCQRMDTAQCNGKLMILLAGVGVEQAMVKNAEPFKSQWGALAYLAGLSKAVSETPAVRLSLTLDGVTRQIETPSIVVANSAPFSSVLAQGGGEPDGNDGFLDITWLDDNASAPNALNAFARLLRAGLFDRTSDKGIHHHRAKHIRISAEQPVPAVVDGETGIETPLDIHVMPQSLAVVSPGVEG